MLNGGCLLATCYADRSMRLEYQPLGIIKGHGRREKENEQEL